MMKQERYVARKIQKYMLDELLFGIASGQRTKTTSIVYSFKLKRMSNYMLAELDKIDTILRQEQAMASKEHLLRAWPILVPSCVKPTLL